MYLFLVGVAVGGGGGGGRRGGAATPGSSITYVSTGHGHWTWRMRRIIAGDTGHGVGKAYEHSLRYYRTWGRLRTIAYVGTGHGVGKA
eukprot:3265427-Rhodomonas_salina.1